MISLKKRNGITLNVNLMNCGKLNMEIKLCNELLIKFGVHCQFPKHSDIIKTNSTKIVLWHIHICYTT